MTGAVEVDEGEHLAADGLVADPEDKIVAPLHGFNDVGNLKEEGSGFLDVHGGEFSAPFAPGRVRAPLLNPVAPHLFTLGSRRWCAGPHRRA